MKKSRIEQLFDQMLDEAPVMFTPKMKPYIIEFAKIYARECIEKSLEKASQDAIVDYENKIVEESIDNEENIILL